MERTFLILGGLLGFLAVLLGAFGAHGLTRHLASVPDAAKRLGWWETAAQYHLFHALAVAFAGYLAMRANANGLASAAGWCFAGGVVLFSGSLYVMAFTGVRWLGAVTPVGGLLFLAGWGLVTAAAWSVR